MRKTLLTATSLFALTLIACNEPSSKIPADTPKAEIMKIELPSVEMPTIENVLLSEFKGPYGGVPAFDKMDLAALKPALEWGMEKNLKEIDAIANNPDAPTFENTILPMEKSGAELDRVFRYWGIWSSNKSSSEFRAIQGEMAPKLSEFSSKITQNEKLFARVKAVYESDAVKSMRPDQQRLMQLVYDGFARNGATLDAENKARYAAINKRLSALHTKFQNNVLADEEGYILYINKDQLSGLSEGYIKAAAATATANGKDGKYAITNTRSSMSPFLSYSDERDLRHKVWETYYSRGDNGDEHDNNAIIAEILQLRDERVGLLGYDNYAQWRLADRMAGNPERALELMEAVWPAAIARVSEESQICKPLPIRKARTSQSRHGITATTPRKSAKINMTSIVMR